jgi:hypothetical protein
MTIYQLHKYGSEWEDAYDYIIGSYLYRVRAEDEMAKAIIQDKKDKELSYHCGNCPLVDDDSPNDEVAKQCAKYCDKFKYVKWGDNGFSCGNYTTHWDDVYFRIEEVEVIE